MAHRNARANAAGVFADQAPTVVAAIETLAWKLGLLTLSLAGMHFLNLFVFHRIRSRAIQAHVPISPYRTPWPQAAMEHPAFSATGQTATYHQAFVVNGHAAPGHPASEHTASCA